MLTLRFTWLISVALTLIVRTAFAQLPANQSPKAEVNPFLSAYATPRQTPPFDKITNAHYLPALREGLAQGRSQILTIGANPAKPTFENTIVALERTGDLLGRVRAVMFNLKAVETTPELQKAVQEASPLLTEYVNDMLLNRTLYARVKSVYTQRSQLKLNPEKGMLLEKTYRMFVRNGANLDIEGKNRLRVIDRDLAQLALQFSENLLNETNAYSMTVTNEKDLAGLPDYVRDAAKATAKQQGKAGYMFTLQFPSLSPFLKYADNRTLRQELYRAYSSRCYHGDKNDNSAIIDKVINLRYERANLLGYKTHADFVLEERMAGSREKVQSFLDELVGYARPAAERQLIELTTYAKAHGFTDEKLQVWDQSYYAEKLKREKYDIDDEVLKPYFKLENVLNGAFMVANKLYGITFKERTDIPLYNPEVKTFDMFDKDGTFLAVFYGDYFPRAGKGGGAWMNVLQGQKMENGQNTRPHVLNVCNFTRPTDTKPSLLTFYEVTTLFHEFGHGLHGMLANSTYRSLSGVNVPWDFVELPSQLMENWCYDPEALKLFAKHYQTGEVIPGELIEKIRASQNFMAGLSTLRQLRYRQIDLYYHGRKPTGESISAVENHVDSLTNLFPRVEGIALSPAFEHIFPGGYSAGFYSYKWSEVLDADAFEFFKEKGGLDNKAAADSFRKNVLEKGGTEKPMELYKKFRGREPSPKAMLRRSGLIL
ncbi:M3 family metallopeptidase [Spirosoma rigui]|uniref:M3 family metallopeptidase n=1 Tax=Spirosoma rigui TaxID=564064 RepID=UPI0009AF5E8A|nr:M3 family metallopeptidase [Spirosoma rigui]